MDRDTTIRMFTHMINMMERHNTMTISCGDLLMELLKDVRELLKEQEETTFKPHYIDIYGKHFICGVECGACHKEISSTYYYCPWCGKPILWEDR